MPWRYGCRAPKKSFATDWETNNDARRLLGRSGCGLDGDKPKGGNRTASEGTVAPADPVHSGHAFYRAAAFAGRHGAGRLDDLARRIGGSLVFHHPRYRYSD